MRKRRHDQISTRYVQIDASSIAERPKKEALIATAKRQMDKDEEREKQKQQRYEKFRITLFWEPMLD